MKGQIESGEFGNDSEYIRHLIRRDQQAKERLAVLRDALSEGGGQRTIQAAGYVGNQDLWPQADESG